MKDRDDLVHAWLLKAQSDLNAARQLVSTPDGPFDAACFHAQQAAEKYLKSFIAFTGKIIPRTHNLEELQRVILSITPASLLSELDLTALTSYAVELRYDIEFWPSREEAVQAIDLAEKVGQAIKEITPE